MTYWYDLTNKRVVSDDERPRDVEVLGPYDTAEEAENWRSTHDAREDAWDDGDEDEE